MLSIIEQKMCTDDHKVWSRDLQRDRKTATLQCLMDWMTVEMKSRMCATAPLKTGPRPHIQFIIYEIPVAKITQLGTNVGCAETLRTGQTNVKSLLLRVSMSD